MSWPQMREYWGSHADARAPVDFDSDPDALANVCTPGVPAWLNMYYARGQREVFVRLLSLVPRTGGRALDIGCGGGRWCRLLSSHGFAMTGVDLQPALIDALRERHPHMQFACASIQDFEINEPFDLVSIVTVLAHNPPEEQNVMFARVRMALRNGGHAIVLENVSDHAAHVFSHPVDEWVTLFRAHELEIVSLRRYDFNPLSRVVASARRRLTRVRRGSEIDVTSHMIPGNEGTTSSGLRRCVIDGVTRLAIEVDAPVERALVARSSSLPSVHCGFLLRAV